MNHNKVCDNFGRYVLYLRVVFSLNLGILLAASIFMFFESSSRIIIPRSRAGCSFVTPVNQYNVHGCIKKTFHTAQWQICQKHFLFFHSETHSVPFVCECVWDNCFLLLCASSDEYGSRSNELFCYAKMATQSCSVPGGMVIHLGQ